jgi:hypothetical protein
MVLCHSQHDSVEPGLEGRSSLEIRQSAVRDEKHILYRIFDVRLGYDQPS